MRNEAMALLAEESRLTQIVKLVGPDALPDEQRLILETSRLLREGFLQQNAMDPIDAYSTIQKQVTMLKLILQFHHRALPIIKHGATIAVIHRLPVVDSIIRMKATVPNDQISGLDEIGKTIDEQMDQLESEYK
jgi:V/A-type H+-transporting ATPase subunit A